MRVFSLASDRKDVLQAGEKMLLLLILLKTLDELRVHKYHEKISRRTQHPVKVEARGPTTVVAQQRVLWINRQMQDWRGDYALDSFKWGWQLAKQGIMPIEMAKQVAASELLKIVKYGCKTDCTRKNCTCRQYGVVCTKICSGCKGVS